MINFENKEYTEEQFLQLYIDQKVKENDEKVKRIEMEKTLLESYGDCVPEDKLSKSIKVGRYTVKVKRNISYKLSEQGWEKVWNMNESDRPIKYEYSHTLGKNIPDIVMEEIENETKPSFEVTYK